ncbi:MAG: hypothetical protein V8T65_08795 [Roseburia inulinivorans]
MKNKRVLAAVLVAAMTLGLTACGGNDSNGSAAWYRKLEAQKQTEIMSRLHMHIVHLIIFPTEEDLRCCRRRNQ